MTGTLKVLTLHSEIYTQVPLSRLKTFHCLCACDTFIGRDPCDQAFDPFDAVQVVFGSNPGCISVSRPNLSAESKETFCRAFKKGFHDFDVIAIFTSLQVARLATRLTQLQSNHCAERRGATATLLLRRV
jgi:hypothetical protein